MSTQNIMIGTYGILFTILTSHIHQNSFDSLKQKLGVRLVQIDLSSVIRQNRLLAAHNLKSKNHI